MNKGEGALLSCGGVCALAHATWTSAAKVAPAVQANNAAATSGDC